MTSEEYGQLIDDFELGADVGPDETLTQYIERRRREFESKADGGSIGIEVLFTEKKPRKNFFMGGPALTGTALDIYNSMKAYGFADEDIANALRARGLYDTTPTPTAPAQPLQPNITRPNGGGKDENDNGGVKDPFGGLGFSSANFGLGPAQNVMDYEADAAKVGRTIRGQFAKGRLGIENLISKMRSLPTPVNIALNLAGKVGNFLDPQKATREAIARESVRDLQNRIDKGDFGSTTPTARDAARGGTGGGRGGSRGGRSAGFDQGERGGPRGRKDGGLISMFTRRR